MCFKYTRHSISVTKKEVNNLKNTYKKPLRNRLLKLNVKNTSYLLDYYYLLKHVCNKNK